MAPEIYLVVLLVLSFFPQASFAQNPPLPVGAIWRQGSPNLHHPDILVALAFAPDGGLLASAGCDGSVRLWNPADGSLVHAFYGNAFDTRLYSLAFSPGGRMLAAGSSNGIYLWDIAARKRVGYFEGGAMVVAFAPDGGSVVGAYSGLSVWSVKTGKNLGRTPPDQRAVYGLAFTPDSKQVIYAHTNPFGKPGETDLLFWDVEKQVQTMRVPGPKDWIRRMVFSPDGAVLAGALHEEVLFWDAATWKPRPGLKTIASDIAFFPRSTRLAVAGNNGVEVWDAATGKKIKTMARQKWVTHLAISPRGHLLATADRDGRIRLWDTMTDKEKLPAADPLTPVVNLAFSPDGQTLASHTMDFVVRLWDAKTGRPGRLVSVDDSRPNHGPNFGPKSLAYSQDGRILVGGDPAGNFRIWDGALGRERRRWPAKDVFTDRFDLAGSGTMLALVSKLEAIELWNLDEGKLIRQLPYSGKRENTFRLAHSSPAFSPTGSMVAAVAWAWNPLTSRIVTGPSPAWPAATVELWQTATGAPLPALKDPELTFARQVLWFPNEKMLATLGQDMLLWDRASRNVCRKIVLENGRIAGHMALSPDGRWLAAGCVVNVSDETGAKKEHVVCHWETASGQIAWRRTGHQGDIRTLAFAPDGLALASGSLDASILMWDLAPPDWQTARLPETFSEKDLERLWQELAGKDAAAGYRAIWDLAARPDQVAAWLESKLTADPALPIAQWLADLQADQFAVREKAKKAIAGLGLEAYPHLQAFDEQKLTLEGQRRVQLLRRDIARQPLTAEQLRQVRSVAVLEKIGTPGARKTLTHLAGGRLTSLQTEHAQAALERLKNKP
jgi:WD40 repeat protein